MKKFWKNAIVRWIGGILLFCLVVAGIFLWRNYSYWRAIRPDVVTLVDDLCRRNFPGQGVRCEDLVDVSGARSMWSANAILKAADGSRAKIALFIKVREAANGKQYVEVNARPNSFEILK